MIVFKILLGIYSFGVVAMLGSASIEYLKEYRQTVAFTKFISGAPIAFSLMWPVVSIGNLKGFSDFACQSAFWILSNKKDIRDFGLFFLFLSWAVVL